MARLDYYIMHGLGNRFVILDSRDQLWNDDIALITKLSDSTNEQTKGCDQVGILLRSSDSEADCYLRIYNADGGEVGACGNLTRCVAWLLAQQLEKTSIIIDTLAGRLNAVCSLDNSAVTVNMGEPGYHWTEIPLTHMVNTMHLPVREGELFDPVAVSMGNPHMVFFVPDIHAIDFEENGLGRKLEHNILFPEKTNVGIAQVDDRETIKLRVFERGVGETQACGTGACAAAVAAMRRNLVHRDVMVHLTGGEIQISWDKDDNVIMTGETFFEESGVMEL